MSAVLKPRSNTETMQCQISQWLRLHSDQAQATNHLFVKLTKLPARSLTFTEFRVYFSFILLDSKTQRILNLAMRHRQTLSEDLANRKLTC